MTAATMPLSFPREIFATVSPASYLLANLQRTSVRANGRKPTDFRKPAVNTNSLSHCFGSAVTRVGNTAVVCGVRGEILLSGDIANPPDTPSSTLQPSPPEQSDGDASEVSQLNLLVPNIELATGSSPVHLPGNPPSTLAQSLSQRLLELLLTTRVVDVRDLRILYQPPHTVEDDEVPDAPPPREVKGYWTLFIDILFLSLDGNPFDAAWGAMLAALMNTRIPKAWWDADLEMILCTDAVAESRHLNLRGLPVASSFGIFNTRRHKGINQEGKEWPLVDPDGFEEELCEEKICVVVDCTEMGKVKICRIEKSGGVVIGMDAMRYLVNAATQRWKEWDGIIRQAGG